MTGENGLAELFFVHSDQETIRLSSPDAPLSSLFSPGYDLQEMSMTHFEIRTLYLQGC